MPPRLTNNYTNETKSQIKQAGLVLLICDFDGALVPLPQTPEEVHMAETVHDHLENICQIESVRFGVISARAPLDLKEKIPLPNCHYLCNHGLEISGPEVNFHHASAEKLRDAIHDAANTLRVQLRVDRTIIEDRGLTAALNYRNVLESQVSSLLAKAKNLLASGVSARKIRIEEGRRSLEIVPAVDWDRGKAVKMLCQNFKAIHPDTQIVLLYVGAEAMDEPAFKYTRQVGIPYRVTQTRETSARYYLKMQTEISRLLRLVRENAKTKAPPKRMERMVL